jgi:RNA-binding protein PNO1
MCLTLIFTPHAFSTVVQGGKNEFRRVIIPPNRYSPLRDNWMKIYAPLVEKLKLQIRFNVKRKAVELRTGPETDEQSAIQKGADFVKAFVLGFDLDDAIALLRMDELFIESFQVHDVKRLSGDHLSRAIGRVAGKDGKTKFAIENVTKTRIVMQDSHIHILGAFSNIKVARDAICDLIMGSAPGKVYAKLRSMAQRLTERF